MVYVLDIACLIKSCIREKNISFLDADKVDFSIYGLYPETKSTKAV